MTQRTDHLLVFIHSLHGGGAERVAVDLCGYWTQAGWRVTLVTQAEADGDVYTLDPAVRRIVLGTAGESRSSWRGAAANWRRVRELRAVLEQERPDIVLGMMTTASVLSVLAARGLPCRVIATEHTHPPAQNLSGFWQMLRRWTYPRAARVVALTRDTAAWLREHVPGSQLEVIPNPVRWPMERGEPIVDPVLADGRRMLLAVGRLHPVKGFDVLLQAFAQVAGDHPAWDLVILGEGAERGALEAQVDELGLRERVDLPGRVGNVVDWYGKADIYVLSSRIEGLSNTLLESMACGVAAVAFDCDTGPRDVVRDDVDGLLVRPAGDAGALARALDRVMGDEALRQRLGAEAEQARERFSMAAIQARWKSVFDAIRGRR